MKSSIFHTPPASSLMNLKHDVCSTAVTTFGVGGVIRSLYEPDSMAELLTVLELLNKKNSPYKLLGAGSNLLLPDEGVESPVLRLGKSFTGISIVRDSINSLKDFTEVSENATSTLESPQLQSASVNHVETISVFALAASSLMGLSRKTSLLGYSGLEFAAGIPATIGGAIAMNAGAHGHSISEVVSKVFTLSSAGEFKVRTVSEMHFSYRRAELSHDEIVLGCEMQLRVLDKNVSAKLRADCLSYRKATQPLHLPSAGSVFKNPAGNSKVAEGELAAGALLEQAGLKGVTRGAICYSELHANWLVRVSENARAKDVLALLSLGQDAVREKFGVDLEPELKIWS